MDFVIAFFEFRLAVGLQLLVLGALFLNYSKQFPDSEEAKAKHDNALYIVDHGGRQGRLVLLGFLDCEAALVDREGVVPVLVVHQELYRDCKLEDSVALAPKVDGKQSGAVLLNVVLVLYGWVLIAEPLLYYHVRLRLQSDRLAGGSRIDFDGGHVEVDLLGVHEEEDFDEILFEHLVQVLQLFDELKAIGLHFVVLLEEEAVDLVVVRLRAVQVPDDQVVSVAVHAELLLEGKHVGVAADFHRERPVPVAFILAVIAPDLREHRLEVICDLEQQEVLVQAYEDFLLAVAQLRVSDDVGSLLQAEYELALL